MKMFGRLVVWGLAACFPLGAHAAQPQEQPEDSLEIGAGLVCNSAQQVERYLTLHTKDGQSPDAAVQAVNSEVHDSHACALALVAFVREEQHATLPAPGGQMRIMKVRIMATQTPNGWQRIENLSQYTAIYEKFDEA